MTPYLHNNKADLQSASVDANADATNTIRK